MKPKALNGLNEDDYGYPLADVSHLTEKEKKSLLRRGRMRPKDLHYDEEFEQWVAVYAPWEAEGSSICICGDGSVECTEPDKEEVEQTIKVIAEYERGEWYFNKRFKAWKEKNLKPLDDKLVEAAKGLPHYDWQFLYELELAKMRCMRAYFSHSRIADREGNFGFNFWIDTCISLLEFLKNDDSDISDEQVRQMNIRNIDDLVSQQMLREYIDAESEEDKLYYGRKLYVRKMERLYYRIRLHSLRDWWE